MEDTMPQGKPAKAKRAAARKEATAKKHATAHPNDKQKKGKG